MARAGVRASTSASAAGDLRASRRPATKCLLMIGGILLAVSLFLAAAGVARAEGDSADQYDRAESGAADQPATLDGQIGIAGTLLACTGCILGYAAGKDLLIVLWG